jgi:hypothetical protein
VAYQEEKAKGLVEALEKIKVNHYPGHVCFEKALAKLNALLGEKS